MQDKITFLIVSALLLAFSIYDFNVWMAHPQQRVERLAKQRALICKNFSFPSSLFTIFAWGFYDRNPKIEEQRSRSASIFSLVMTIVPICLGIYSRSIAK
jgi:hypothetical protein